MAEEVVVREPLTREMMEDGKNLLAALDATQSDVQAALWFFDVVDSQWLLVFALPSYDQEGPRATYAKVREAISSQPELATRINLRQVRVISPKDPLIQLLTTFVPTPPGTHGMRLQHNRFNDILLEDVYVYRALRQNG